MAAKRLRISRLKIVNKAVSSLSDEEYRQCRLYNLAHFGLMRDQLIHYYHNPDRNARAVMLMTRRGEIVSWALVFPPRYNQRVIYFYTRRQYRRQGLGAYLVSYANRRYPTNRVAPHDRPSAHFFKALNCRPLRSHARVLNYY